VPRVSPLPLPPHAGDVDLLPVVRAMTVVWEQPFTTPDVTKVRHALRDQLRGAGPADDIVDDFLVAAHELVINAVTHGGGAGVLRLRHGDGVMAVEVSDEGPGFAGGVTPAQLLPAGDVVGGRGLALARMLTEGLVLVSGPGGVSATVLIRIR